MSDGTTLVPKAEGRSLAWKVGQMLAVGFPGGEEGFGVLARVAERTLAGNLILFSRNGSSAEEASRSACRGRRLVREATGVEPLVAVDQEGGTVARIRRGVTSIPGAMALSAAFLGGAITLADVESLGETCGAELVGLGIDWNLAPVADVNSNPWNPVIGVRSFGENPHVVSAMAAAFARGLARAGVVATAKHFPGHGDTALDSHLDLPTVPHGFPRLDEVELFPFRRLVAEGIPAIMTSHVRFPAVEPDPLPATLSWKVLTGLLRGKLGFAGLICSDCMEMKAVADRYPDRFVEAIEAGVDLLFVSHTETVQEEAATAIIKAVESGRISQSRIDESVERIIGLKRFRKAAMQSSQRGTAESGRGMALAARAAEGSLSLLSSASKATGEDAPEGRVRLVVDCGPAISSAAEGPTERPSLAEALETSGSPIQVVRFPANPGAEDVEEAIRMVAGVLEGAAEGGRGDAFSPRVALALSLPGREDGQRSLLAKALDLSARRGEPLCVLLTRSPYDFAEVAKMAEDRAAPQPVVVCAYEYTAASVAALAAYLSGDVPVRGVCPVRLRV